MIQRAGFNPYQVAPNDPRVAGKIPELARVPRNDDADSLRTGAEVLFRAIPATNNALAYKLIFGAADLLAIALLLRLLDKQTAAWFAWNPLVAYSFFGAAHFDSIILLAIVALIFLPRTICTNGTIALEICPWCRARAWSRHRFSTSLRRLVHSVSSLPCVATRLRSRPPSLCPFALPSCFTFHFAPNLFGDFGHVSRLNDLFWWLIEDTILTKLASAILSLRCNPPHRVGG